MKLKYKLLSKGTGILITRQPRLASDEKHVCFIGAPQNATAIFKTSNASFYRKLTNGGCVIPVNMMSGEITVTVTVLDGEGSGNAWICEGLMFEKDKNGDTLIFPNDMDIPNKFATIELEFDEHKKYVKMLEEKIDKLENKLSEILEGYDLT